VCIFVCVFERVWVCSTALSSGSMLIEHITIDVCVCVCVCVYVCVCVCLCGNVDAVSEQQAARLLGSMQHARLHDSRFAVCVCVKTWPQSLSSKQHDAGSLQKDLAHQQAVVEKSNKKLQVRVYVCVSVSVCGCGGGGGVGGGCVCVCVCETHCVCDNGIRMPYGIAHRLLPPAFPPHSPALNASYQPDQEAASLLKPPSPLLFHLSVLSPLDPQPPVQISILLRPLPSTCVLSPSSSTACL